MKELKHILLYLAGPALAIVGPLISYPAIVATHGIGVWADFAVGQSIGIVAATLIEMSWGTRGPQIIAQSAPHDYPNQLRRSFSNRLVALSFAIPLITAYCIFGLQKPQIAIYAILFAISGITNSWFYVGLNRPDLQFGAESLPRFAGNVLSSGFILLGASATILPLALVACAIYSQLYSQRLFPETVTNARRSAYREFVKEVRSSRSILLARATSSVYSTGAIAIAAAYAPAITSALSALDRLVRLVLMGLTPVPMRLQNWVGTRIKNKKDKRKTIDRVIAINLTTGILFGALFTYIGPLLVQLLFRGQINLSSETYLAAGLLILTICGSRGIGLLLVAERQESAIAKGSFIAAAITLFAFAYFNSTLNITEAVCILLAAESMGMAIQACALRRHVVNSYAASPRS